MFSNQMNFVDTDTGIYKQHIECAWKKRKK